MNVILGLIFPLISIQSDEIWKRRLPKKAEHIRVCRGMYYHHGIYISDDEVIHFSALDDDGLLDWSKCEVIITNIYDFLKNGVLEVREYRKSERKYLKKIEDIIDRARTCVGKKGYNLIFNNCEHFANDCTIGEKKSTQVQKVILGRLAGDTSFVFMPIIKFLIGKSHMGFLFILGALATAVLSTDTGKNKPKKTKTNKKYIANEIIIDSCIKDTEQNEEIVSTVLSIQEKSRELCNKRIQIIEQGSLDMIKQVEIFYDEMIAKIKKENEDYVNVKLPSMFKNLDKYENNSEVYNIYKQVIQDDIAMKFRHYEMYMDMLISHQDLLIKSIVDNKNLINKKLDILTEKIVYENNYEICA